MSAKFEDELITAMATPAAVPATIVENLDNTAKQIAEIKPQEVVTADAVPEVAAKEVATPKTLKAKKVKEPKKVVEETDEPAPIVDEVQQTEKAVEEYVKDVYSFKELLSPIVKNIV
jgi:hypothetical protein